MKPSEPSGVPEVFEQEDPVAVLREVQALLSVLYHDASNPLSIISGNAQFVLELLRSPGVADELKQPVQDIDEACRRVSDKLQDLRELKERIGRYVEGAAPPA